VAIYMSINTSSSINCEANSCWLRCAAHRYSIHATRTLMPTRQYFAIVAHIPGEFALSISHIIDQSQSANTPHDSQSMAQYSARSNIIDLALLLVTSDYFACIKVRSNSCVRAMTLAQSTASHMLATSRFVATQPASAVTSAKQRWTLCTYVTTLRILTSLTPAMCYAKHSRT
jgi:hypothetical protein